MISRPTTWAAAIHSPLKGLVKAAPTPRNAAPVAHGGSDELLFGRVCETGDQAAFGELVQKYRFRVAGLAKRMFAGYPTLADEIEDIAQEAFVDAFHKRGTFRKGDAFRPWLYRIVVNRCIDRMRRARRAPSAVLLDSDLADAASSPEEEVLRIERHRLIDQAVTQLPPKHRAALVLRYIDDLSYEEIAAATDLPLGTVKTYLFRARTELRQRLEAAESD